LKTLVPKNIMLDSVLSKCWFLMTQKRATHELKKIDTEEKGWSKLERLIRGHVEGQLTK
jgi:hypothetical protein